jgi:GTPase SAR1 family protein
MCGAIIIAATRMPFFEDVGIELAKEIGKRLIDAVTARRKDAPVESAPADFQTKISDHLAFVARITERVEFFGLARGKQTDQDTVDLFLSLPRKFVGSRFQKQMKELALLQSSANHVLLGAPGSGKTTTVKRLARHLLNEAPLSPRDGAQYPVLVRLRTISGEQGLLEALGDIFGLTEQASWFRKEKEPRSRHLERQARMIGFVADRTGALLLFDGLDEVDGTLRPSVEDEITFLAESCDASKIIVTCRSGDYNSQLSRFDVLELAPLEPHQIEMIVKRWTNDALRFLNAVRAQPFLDLTTRPLFLCQLLTIFNQTDSIPDQPTDVVERVVRLALEEWDERHKKQPRRSRYATFDSSRKRDFLANMAFWFTYVSPKEQLSTSALEVAYGEIHERFGLPAGDAKLVAHELETHTGIFVEVGTVFEFSHLSLQEFLTATYLVRQPLSKAFTRYLTAKPAPLAVAAALSTRPEIWLSQLLLSDPTLRVVPAETWRSFFSRLLQERPAFVKSASLGFACIAFSILGPYKDDFVRQFLLQPVIQESIKTAAAFYQLKRDRTTCRISLHKRTYSDFEVHPLHEISVVPETMNELSAAGILRTSDLSA